MDSELVNRLNELDEEEKTMLEEENKALEELNIISEKHRNMTIVFNKVIINIGLMTKKKSQPLKESYFEKSSENNDKEESFLCDSLVSDYETYLIMITEKINHITSTNSKLQFDESLKRKGCSEIGNDFRTDQVSLLRGPVYKEKVRAVSNQLSSTFEYVYDDPETKNEDKSIQDETDKMIYENKIALNKRRDDMKEGIKERKK